MTVDQIRAGVDGASIYSMGSPVYYGDDDEPTQLSLSRDIGLADWVSRNYLIIIIV